MKTYMLAIIQDKGIDYIKFHPKGDGFVNVKFIYHNSGERASRGNQEMDVHDWQARRWWKEFKELGYQEVKCYDLVR